VQTARALPLTPDGIGNRHSSGTMRTSRILALLPVMLVGGSRLRETRCDPPPMRVRRANTRLTAVDSVILGYEEGLREHSSLEKLFKYFASKVVNGRELMTPLDFVRAITPGAPPSPMSKPINIPLFENDPAALRKLSAQEVPPFFKFMPPDDLGLISFGRFLILLAVMAVPSEQLDVLYYMNSGPHFRNPALRSDGITLRNFDHILASHIKTRQQGYDPSARHSSTSILRYLFGPNLDRSLSLESLRVFHHDLRREVVKLEYFLLGDVPDSMSLVAFARSVASLVPSDKRKEFRERCLRLGAVQVPEDFLPQGASGPMAVADVRVSLEEYIAWKEVLKLLEMMESAVRLYSHEDGHFTPTSLLRAAKAVAGVDLAPPLVFALFALFDPSLSYRLNHNDFVKLLNVHSVSESPKLGPDGLQLHLLARCTRECGRAWLEGTLKE